jgi:hypothetical protein
MENQIREFQRGSAVDWNSQEVVNDFLYDWQAYPVAGLTQLAFFATPQGQGVSFWDATQTKTYEDTNMEVGNQMARGESFLVKHIALRFYQATLPVQYAAALALPAVPLLPANDAHLFWNRGWLEFKIVNKVQARQGPLASFPPPNYLELDAAAAIDFGQVAAATASNQFAASNLRARGPLYTLAGQGATLEYGMKFQLTLNWAAKQAITTAGGVQAMLIGKRMRVSQ